MLPHMSGTRARRWAWRRGGFDLRVRFDHQVDGKWPPGEHGHPGRRSESDGRQDVAACGADLYWIWGDEDDGCHNAKLALDLDGQWALLLGGDFEAGVQLLLEN